MTDPDGNIAIFEAFEHRPEGTWICIAPIIIETEEGSLHVEPGTTFAFGDRRNGLDVAEYLEQLGAQFGS